MAHASRYYPRRIDHRREARNSHVPQSSFKSRLLHAQNHALSFRRKHFFSWADMDNKMTGSSGTVTRFRFRGHAGYGATHFSFQFGLFLHDTVIGAPADPTVSVIVTEAGGAALPTQSIHYGMGDGTPTDSPDEVAQFPIRVPVSANTTYEVAIQTIDYARIAWVVAYEEASQIIDPAVDHYAEEAVGSVGFPIFDTHRETHMVGLSEMWRKNGVSLFCYPGPSTGTLSPGTTWTGLFDGSTSITSASAKVALIDPDQSAQLCRVSDGSNTVDVVLAVYGQAIGGNTGEVRFADSGATWCSITGITTTLQWHTTTTTIADLDAISSADVQLRNSNAGHQIAVHAISLYVLA